MIEDDHNVRAAEMEMFSSACRLGKVFHKYNANISKQNTFYFLFFSITIFYYYFWGVDVDTQVVNT